MVWAFLNPLVIIQHSEIPALCNVRCCTNAQVTPAHKLVLEGVGADLMHERKVEPSLLGELISSRAKEQEGKWRQKEMKWLIQGHKTNH